MMKLLRYAALFGNLLYILWITYNAIDDGFQAVRTVEAVALCGLVILLSLNFIILLKNNKNE